MLCRCHPRTKHTRQLLRANASHQIHRRHQQKRHDNPEHQEDIKWHTDILLLARRPSPGSCFDAARRLYRRRLTLTRPARVGARLHSLVTGSTTRAVCGGGLTRFLAIVTICDAARGEELFGGGVGGCLRFRARLRLVHGERGFGGGTFSVSFA